MVRFDRDLKSEGKRAAAVQGAAARRGRPPSAPLSVQRERPCV